MRPALLLLVPGTERGGCEEYALTMACELAATYAVVVAVQELPGMAGVREEVRRLAIPTRTIRWEDPAAGSWGTASEQLLQARSLLRRDRFGIVLMALPHPFSGHGWIAACESAALPYVPVFQLTTEELPFDPWLISRVPSLSVGNRTPHWIGVSRSTAAAAARSLGVADRLFTVVHNGVPVPATLPAAQERDAGRRACIRELGLPSSSSLVLTVGRLSSQKDPWAILKAAWSLRDARPPVHFLWAGAGELEADLTHEIEALGLGNVHLLGHRTDVDALLVASNLFVLPSLHEGMPFAALEAMSHGCPVVLSDVEGNRELVRAGIDGVLWTRGNHDQLAEAIRFLLGSPTEANRLAHAAHASVQSGFTRDMMVGRTKGILERLLGGDCSAERRSSPPGKPAGTGSFCGLT